ncbi:hypothetical protein VL20_1620 [Microcystis panniformis FACHB-1757]|uniref:Uncharacterized protein n=1 Tax=Microcystis panniformis FACHB-1757 TaxID=1638788 RepID=A0A0K1RYJ7_9CHRO|nr:hypothetical protein VL20_1620 [Microcystis panniformis FACHB-1757]
MPPYSGGSPAYRHPPYQGGQGGSNLKSIFNLIITSYLIKWFQLDYNQLLTQKISTDNIK